MEHLYFVRHGLSVMNKEGFFSGRTDTPLAPEGFEQARQAGEAAKKLNIDLLVTSPMERARETAFVIAKVIGYPVQNIIVNDLFMERAFGVLEGTEFSHGMDVEGHEGVETGDEILARAQAGIEFLRSQPHDNIMVVSHGAIGRAMRHLLNPNIAYHGSGPILNAEIVELL